LAQTSESAQGGSATCNLLRAASALFVKVEQINTLVFQGLKCSILKEAQSFFCLKDQSRSAERIITRFCAYCVSSQFPYCSSSPPAQGANALDVGFIESSSRGETFCLDGVVGGFAFCITNS
jgi:hypothetical protein